MVHKKIAVAGHICVDLTPVFPPGEKGSVREALVPGRLLHMEGMDIHTGGVVSNTGLALKKLGASVELMGKVGKDELGRLVLEIMRSHGICRGITEDDSCTTSYTIALAIPGLDRIFLHNPGANDTYASEDIREEGLEDAALFHFGYPPLMRRMYENGGRELLRIFRRVKEKGIATSLDMAAVDADSDAGKADWREILKSVLPYVDFFMPSAEELLFMMDRERYDFLQKAADGGEILQVLEIDRDIRPLGEALIQMGAAVVLIKCGALGIYYRTASKERLKKAGKLFEETGQWENREGFEKSYKPERVLSGTGAGDTTIAAFLLAALKGRSLEQSLKVAAAAGASCVEALDALGGLKSFEELERKIRNGWEKNESGGVRP
ncbi:MAG TPA: carbohydrate kinase family protein [Candidatus Choladousia intestinavium]|uniref:Carbohydrate kinase family protein n=1 Tax=Candidatus Choladousia intestinavium TaxID=2840727 RepID=A0A9D1ACE2_9FIRM|nr:carbohydrate kinase family protein [Candidatus Choladousia intestinavium]